MTKTRDEIAAEIADAVERLDRGWRDGEFLTGDEFAADARAALRQIYEHAYPLREHVGALFGLASTCARHMNGTARGANIEPDELARMLVAMIPDAIGDGGYMPTVKAAIDQAVATGVYGLDDVLSVYVDGRRIQKARLVKMCLRWLAVYCGVDRQEFDDALDELDDEGSL